MLLLLVSLCLFNYLRTCAGGACTEEQGQQERKCYADIWEKEYASPRAEYLMKLENEAELYDVQCATWKKFEKCLPDCEPLAYGNTNKMQNLVCQPEFKEIWSCVQNRNKPVAKISDNTRTNRSRIRSHPLSGNCSKSIAKECYAPVKGKEINVTINGYETEVYEREDICPVQKCFAERISAVCGKPAYQLYEKFDLQNCFSDPI